MEFDDGYFVIGHPDSVTWTYGVDGDPVAPALYRDERDDNSEPYFEGAVHHGDTYVARCTLAHPPDVDPHMSTPASDIVTVGRHQFQRTRYRACCNPFFIEHGGKVYVIINSGPSTLSIYEADSGALYKTIQAPEFMVAICGDKNGQKLHLFGWDWGPHENYQCVTISDLFD